MREVCKKLTHIYTLKKCTILLFYQFILIYKTTNYGKLLP